MCLVNVKCYSLHRNGRKTFTKTFIFILDDNKREIKKEKTLYRKKYNKNFFFVQTQKNREKLITNTISITKEDKLKDGAKSMIISRLELRSSRYIRTLIIISLFKT